MPANKSKVQRRRNKINIIAKIRRNGYIFVYVNSETKAFFFFFFFKTRGRTSARLEGMIAVLETLFSKRDYVRFAISALSYLPLA